MMLAAFAILGVASAAAVGAMLWLAPHGYENETGFHLGEQPIEELAADLAKGSRLRGQNSAPGGLGRGFESAVHNGAITK